MSKPYWEDDFDAQIVKAHIDAYLAEYRREVREFWTREVAPMCALTSGTIFGLTWVLSRTLDISGYDQWYAAGALVLVALTILVKYMYPDRLTEDSIVYSLMLNRIGAAVCHDAPR